MKKCGFPAVHPCETGSETGKDEGKVLAVPLSLGTWSFLPQLPARAFSRFADARSWRATRLPGCLRRRHMRTRTWAVTGAFIRHMEQKSMSHFSSRVAPSSRKRCHPKHERSVPGTLLLRETHSSQGWHRDRLLLIPPWEQLCCLTDGSELARAGRGLRVLHQHSKATAFHIHPPGAGAISH